MFTVVDESIMWRLDFWIGEVCQTYAVLYRFVILGGVEALFPIVDLRMILDWVNLEI